MTDAPLVWEQQPGESAKAFAAFAVYRDMQSERSVRAVARNLNKSVTQMGEWSAKHHWVSRAVAHDLHQDRIRREAADKAVRQMGERHAAIAGAGLAKVTARIQQLNPDDIPAGQLGSMARHLVDVERRARGVNDRIEVALALDSAEWTEARAALLEALLPFPEALEAALYALDRRRS